MSSVLDCPECEAKVRVPAGVAAGKKVRCPRCQTVFTTPGSTSAVKSASPPGAGSRRRPEPPDEQDDEDDRPTRSSRSRRDEDDDEEEVRRPKKKLKKKPAGGGGGKVLLWVALALVLLGGGGIGAYFAFFNKGKETGPSDSKGTTPNGGKPGGGEQNEPEGTLTAGNFKKLRVNMPLTDVLRIIGQGKTLRDNSVRNRRVMELVWEDSNTPQPTKITGGFVNGMLIDAQGTINGQRVNARANTPGGGRNDRVSAANYQRISEAFERGQPMNRAQIIEILGEPSQNLGPQMSIGGQQADETLLWVNGGTQITFWFLRGQNIGSQMRDR